MGSWPSPQIAPAEPMSSPRAELAHPSEIIKSSAEKKGSPISEKLHIHVNSFRSQEPPTPKAKSNSMFKKFSPRRSENDSENIEIDHDAIHVEIDSPNLPMQSSTVKSCTKNLQVINASLDSRSKQSSATPQPPSEFDDNLPTTNPPILAVK